MRRRFLNKNNKNTLSDSIYHSEYFTIEPINSTITVRLSDNTVYSQLDDGDWVARSANDSIEVLLGQKLHLKINNPSINSGRGIGMFNISGLCNISGNIMSLLYGDDFINLYSLPITPYTFYMLFYGCKTIKSAANLVLPEAKPSKYCYSHMFYGCVGLEEAPKVPATTLADYCYYSMFENCTSLTTAPELPAKTLKPYCYWCMFENCTSLVLAPDLDAMNLAESCYRAMFKGCSNLKNLPKLPATTIAKYCYAYMFLTCTSFNLLITLPANILEESCYESMFNGCSSLTIAPTVLATALAPKCFWGFFAGCSSLVLIDANYLPVSTVVDSCYRAMFKNCKQLAKAPDLPAQVLANQCYYEMFCDCSKLNHINMLATDISASNCLNNWVNGVSSTGTFVKHPDMTSLPTGSSGIPSGWTVENA